MPGISVHVVDVSRGLPARGMQVEVTRIEPGGRTRAGGGTVGEGGLLDDAALGRGDGVIAGLYEIELATGAWYREQGVAVGTPAFQEAIVYRFGITDPTAHIHLPIKLSPFGISVWRGA